jgi:hypothetical protein
MRIALRALIVLAPALFCLPAPAQTTSSVVVNGRDIPAITINGKTYVTPEDVARALGGSLSYAGSTIILTSPATVHSASDAAGGKIAGVLTYYFNDNYGSKPDVGAEVYLLDGDIDLKPNQMHSPMNDHTYLIWNASGPVQYHVAASTSADGSGKFELSNVPAGKYTLLVQSKHAVGAVSRDIPGKMFIKPIAIKDGDVIDASHDFGPSAF